MAEGFSCSLDVIYKGLGKSKLQYLVKKEKKLSSVLIFFIFGHKTLDPEPEPDFLEMLDPHVYQDSNSMNPDPTCLQYNKCCESGYGTDPDPKPLMQRVR
jgi:hypothetical protein